MEQIFDNATNLNQFTTLGGFIDETNKLDTVTTRTVQVTGIEALDEAYKALVFERSNRRAAIVSRDYQEIQNREALQQVAEALRKYNIEPRGRITETERGRLSAKLYFQNQDYEFKANTTAKFDDILGLGLSLSNTYGDVKASFKGETMGVRRICWNENLWGDWLGEVTIRHAGNILLSTGLLIEQQLDAVPMMQEAIELASVLTVPKQHLLPALRGIGVGPRIATTILADGLPAEPTFVPEAKEQTAWALYNAATHVFTRRRASDETRDDYLHKANRLLTSESLESSIDKGLEVLQKEAED